MQEPEWPLVAVVARLTEQKGFDLIRQVLPRLMDLGVQLVIFGQGDRELSDFFRQAAEQWPEQMGFSDQYTDETASKIFAGADFYLMPSRFDPCGLSQMMAMRYGTVPIVRETGGLRDSVRPYSIFDGLGDGFSFSEYHAQDLYLAVLQAVKTYFGDPDMFEVLRHRCMTKDFSWKKSAGQYLQMYAEISDRPEGQGITFETAFRNLRSAYLKIDEQNKRMHADQMRMDYHRVVEIEIVGEGAGFLHVMFDHGAISVEPTRSLQADAYISSDYLHLLQMARGESTLGKLYMKGLLRISGNLAKGFEIKHLLCPK